MKPFLLTILLANLCAVTGYAQTIKSLAYNATNGQVVYSGTNTLTFTNSTVAFSAASFANQIQTPAGTAGTPAFRFSTNAVGLYYGSQFGIGGFVGVSLFSNAVARFATNKVLFDQPLEFPNATNATITRTNLSLGAAWLTNTDVTNFRAAIGFSTNLSSFWNATNSSTWRGLLGVDTGTNEPFTGTVYFFDPEENNSKAMVFTNGILINVFEL